MSILKQLRRLLISVYLKTHTTQNLLGIAHNSVHSIILQILINARFRADTNY
jgi:hypothetical protein